MNLGQSETATCRPTCIGTKSYVEMHNGVGVSRRRSNSNQTGGLDKLVSRTRLGNLFNNASYSSHGHLCLRLNKNVRHSGWHCVRIISHDVVPGALFVRRDASPTQNLPHSLKSRNLQAIMPKVTDSTKENVPAANQAITTKAAAVKYPSKIEIKNQADLKREKATLCLPARGDAATELVSEGGRSFRVVNASTLAMVVVVELHQ